MTEMEYSASQMNNVLGNSLEYFTKWKEMEAVNKTLTDRIAALVADGIHIEWMNEDELPEEISDEVYSTMYACSVVDFVRLFPFVTIDGRKRFLIELPDREQ
ncbi:MAG: hypothetical protein AAGU15_08900 [Anaerolineaceae bacterium]